ncbi:hypothetical protein T05_6 [Trichinella murrelli]|uniref:Uncharacterized protein n=1 Tax=Trichinella murrelli TaxID=144512 RepID=A0A0V0STS5_9BILA|nr:hypothetical protein T05_6 [Trichinella murrelli]
MFQRYRPFILKLLDNHCLNKLRLKEASVMLKIGERTPQVTEPLLKR